MKINWGTAIVIAFVLFAGMLTYYMIRGAQNPSDLVAEDYYEQEIKYQDRIDNRENANQLGALVINRNANTLQIVFPKGLNKDAASGIIYFYKPNKANFDFEVPLQIDTNFTQEVDVTTVIKGQWVLKIEVQADGKTYYWEKPISV